MQAVLNTDQRLPDGRRALRFPLWTSRAAQGAHATGFAQHAADGGTLTDVRIAILSTSYPRSPGDAAGLFVQVEALELQRQGNEVHVLAPGRRTPHRDANDVDRTGDGAARHGRSGPPDAEKGERARDGVVMWPLGAEELFGWPGAVHRVRESPLRLLLGLGFGVRARAALRRIAPERTVAHFVVPCGYPLSLASTGELEVVLHGSDARAVCALPRALRAEIARSLLARGASLRFASERLRGEFVRAFAPATARALLARSRVVLPGLGLDLAPVPRERAARARGTSEPEAWVACGRLIASKRVDRVIREAARRGAQLTVVGDGPERDRLRALAARVLPSTRFTGHLPRDQALAQIAGSDRLVHLSELEGAPSVIREARALGVPVLATAAGDIAEWARRDPGIELFVVSDELA